MVTINLRSGKADVYIDLESLPIVITQNPSKFGLVPIIFGGIFAGLPLLMVLTAMAAGRFESSMLLVLPFLAFGAVAILAGLYVLTHRRQVTIDGRQVESLERSCFGDKNWTEPLSGYDGIWMGSEQRSTGGENSSTYTVHVLRLYHTNRKRRILLHESRREEGVRGRWEAACRLLNMPALEGAKGEFHRREVEDLDRSVVELVREKKLQVDFDRAALPPQGIEVNDNFQSLEIIIRRRQAALWAWPIALAIPGIFIFMGFGPPGAPLLFGIAGVAVMVVMLAFLIWDRITVRRIVVSGEEIRWNRLAPWGPTREKSASATEIESIIVSIENGHRQVTVATDNQNAKLGQGLPKTSLAWLRDCLLDRLSR